MLVGPDGRASQVVGDGQVSGAGDAGRADAEAVQVSGLDGPARVEAARAGGLGAQHVMLGDQPGQQERRYW